MERYLSVWFRRFSVLRIAGHRLGPAFALLAFSLAYFLAVRLGIATSLPPEGIVTIWPANAIIVAALAAVERRRWWAFFVATVVTEIAADVPDYPLWAATAYGVVNFSEAALAVVLLSAVNDGRTSLVGLRDFVRYLAVGPLLASGTAALFGAGVYKLGAPDLDYLHYWRVFWLGDATGLLVVGTVLLAWRRPVLSLGRSVLFMAAEAAILLIGLLAMTAWILLVAPDMPRIYLIFPFLVWASLRFGVHGASVVVVMLTAVVIGATMLGHGPFTDLVHIDVVVGLQGLIAVAALAGFMLAFTVEDSWRTTTMLEQSVKRHEATERELTKAYGKLERVNRTLDKMVDERTADLRQALARNEMLMREVHHRVKNNLQVVSSLLALQGRSASAPELRAKLLDVQAQVSAIGTTYALLQRMESVDVVDFCKVMPALARNIQDSHGENASIAVDARGNAMVSADSAVALSLALNELITNSIKHASRGTRASVVVRCRREGDRVAVAVADNGPGFPAGFDIDAAKGFGIRMASGMVIQAGGTIRVAESDAGAVVEVTVPADGGAS